MNYDWNTIKLAKKALEESQKEKFPYFVDPKEVFNLKIQINKQVFSPKYAKGYKCFIPFLPDVYNKKVLEVGCGSGVVSCYLAKTAKKVLAVDINPYAIENTKINAEYNCLNNLEVRKSDVFSSIKENEKFDLIFWNVPWAKLPKTPAQKLKPEEYSIFDFEHEALSRFILESKNHLTKVGEVYFFYGEEGSDLSLIKNLIIKSKGKKEIIKKFIFEEKAEEEKIKYHAELVKLTFH